MRIDTSHNQPCQIGSDCPDGQSCDIPTHTCMPDGVAIVNLPPDDSTKSSWTDTIFAKVKDLVLAWRETKIAYDTMRYTRQDWGVALIGNGWSQAQDDQFWLLNQVVLTLSTYVGQINDGVRDVAYDTFGKQPVIVGDLGDMFLRVEGDVLHVNIGSAEGDVNKGGFVSGPELVAVAVMVVAGALAEIAFVIALAYVIHDYIVKLSTKDVIDAREREAQACIAKGGDSQSCYQSATDNTAKTLKALTDKAIADANAGPKGGLETFEKIAWISLGVAVIGVTAYFAAPFIKGALASGSSRRQLAQENPTKNRSRKGGKYFVEYRRFHDKGPWELWAGAKTTADVERVLDNMQMEALRLWKEYGPDGMFAKEYREIAEGRVHVRVLDQNDNITYELDTVPVSLRSPVFSVGDRVQLHPGTDRWMRGDRYGEIVKKDIGSKVMVHLDKSGKKIWFKIGDVTPINENPSRRKLRSEIESSEIESEVESLARSYAPEADQIFPVFEHGQWWVTVSPDPDDPSDENSEATFSVVDTSNGLDLERV